MKSLKEALAGEIYQAYSYSYPHKSAYRTFNAPIDLHSLWKAEKKDALFLYVHIPYCEMRCGFCNLFTLVRPDSQQSDDYLSALKRQSEALSPSFQSSSFSRFALGGGTPTFLSRDQLSFLFEILEKYFGINFSETPSTIETSPDTCSAEKMRLLNQRGVARISIGVQSFFEQETLALTRRQSPEKVHSALDCIRSNLEADLNIDLIYGIPGQTPNSWINSLKEALKYKPEELYLYPLYIREKTGLNKIQEKNIITKESPKPNMLELYRLGRAFLLSNGYEQISMRMFRKKGQRLLKIPEYSCQEDGMLGLGAGARSYTRQLHYSSEYAVGRKEIKSIVEHYIKSSAAEFSHGVYGIELSRQEQARRFLIQSLLLAEGLSLDAYYTNFNSQAVADFSQLVELIEEGLAINANGEIKLTAEGLERSDTLGWWLISPEMKTRMEQYHLK